MRKRQKTREMERNKRRYRKTSGRHWQSCQDRPKRQLHACLSPAQVPDQSHQRGSRQQRFQSDRSAGQGGPQATSVLVQS